MPASADILPLSDTVTPADQEELAQMVREAHRDGLPIYPVGGATSLDYGLPAADPGIGLSLRALKRVVDYPARDMTITVESGITIDALSSALRSEGQRLPVDLPDGHQATLGGVLACNASGARRYGNGTVRDYVIGISAVDGRGMPFRAGGRVVKNVAGYDFCKLLVGSMGTIGVITQVTLRVKPIPKCSRFVACRARSWAEADARLQEIVAMQIAPAAVELLSGRAWQDDPALGSLSTGEVAHLLIGLEGTEPEVAWMGGHLADRWRAAGTLAQTIPDDQTGGLWTRLAQFPANREAPLVIKACVLPSRVIEFIEVVRSIDPNCSLQVHAANGIVVAHMSEFGSGGMSKALVGTLQPAAAEQQGHVVVLRCQSPGELTRQCWWGSIGASASVMESVKRQFDPRNLLNRGRYIFAGQ